MRIALFALTGVGNAVLTALCAAGCRPGFVVTREEPHSYPYYQERSFEELASELEIECLRDAEGERRVVEERPDVLFVATYHRILKRQLIQSVRWPLNVHPSLLPAYRGPNPFYWVIRNGEQRTGVTIHELAPELDRGAITWSDAIDLAPDETQGSLRRRLAGVAAHGVLRTLARIDRGSASFEPQNEDIASYRPGIPQADRIIDPKAGSIEISRIVRALSPFPGCELLGRKIVGLVGIAKATNQAAPGTVVSEDAAQIRLRAHDADVVLRRA
ncbi:MAG: formyltransferase family protein [Roseiarcus sp.]|jgi:methionyl-tRNA formyltransferase